MLEIVIEETLYNSDIIIEDTIETTTIVIDEAGVVGVPISEDADNQAERRADGIYVPLPYKTPVEQTRGVSEEAVMSQDATTKEIESLEQSLSTLDNKKVDKEVGKELSDNNYSDSDKSVVDDVGSNLSDLDSRKVDKIVGHSLVQNTEIDKLATVQQYATQNSTDETLLTRSNHIGQQGMNTITGLTDKFTTKVDKVAGKSLIFDSEVTRLANMQTYTLAEKNKLAGLESSRFKGVFPSLGSLQAGVISPQAGDYADVDSVGVDVMRYIYDATDSVWVVQQSTTSVTAAQVKQLYESNPDTNVFDDDSKRTLDDLPLALNTKVDKESGKSLVSNTEITKLVTVQENATANRADSENADKVHTHTTAQVTGLDSALAGKASNNDPRLTDAREWSEDTVTQAEAEAGISSTRRAWTAQRVRQAINAWWQLVTSGFGRSFIAVTNEQAARNVLQLGTAATMDVATNAQALTGTAGVLPDAAGVHAAFKQFGYGGQNPRNLALDCNDLLAGSRNSWSDGIEESTAVSLNLPALGGSSSAARSWHVECFGTGSSRLVQEATEVFGVGTTRGRTFTRVKHDTVWYPWVEVMRTGAYGLGEQFLAGRPATNLGWNAVFGMNVVAINSSGSFMSYLGIEQNTARIINDDGDNLILAAELHHTGNILQATGQSTQYPMTQKATTDALDEKVDKVVGKQLSDENYTTVEKAKLNLVQPEATKNSTDGQLRDRTTHTGVQPISSISNLQTELDSKLTKPTDGKLYGVRNGVFVPIMAGSTA